MVLENVWKMHLKKKETELDFIQNFIWYQFFLNNWYEKKIFLLNATLK